MSLSITRVFPATPEEVFDAWTDPAQFAQWFGTQQAQVDQVEMDVRAEGEWKARMVAEINGEQHVMSWRGAFKEVDRPTRLALTITDAPGPEMDLITVDLKAVDGGTEMHMQQLGDHMDVAAYEGAKQGWMLFFDDFEKLLTS